MSGYSYIVHISFVDGLFMTLNGKVDAASYPESVLQSVLNYIPLIRIKFEYQESIADKVR